MRFNKRMLVLITVLALCIAMSVACTKDMKAASAEAAPTEAAPAEASAEAAPTEAAPADSSAEAAPAEAAPAEAAPADASASVAVTLGNYTILVSDVANDYDYFITYMSYYGMEVPTDPDEIREYVETVVDTKISDYAYAWKADELGLTLTPEQETEVDASVAAEKKEIEDSYREVAAEELGADATEEQIAARAKEMIDQDVQMYLGYDFDTYMAMFRESLVVEAKGVALEAYVKDNVTVTEEETAAWYAAAVEKDKAAVEADPFAFRDTQENYEAHISDTPAFYAPAGFVRVQTIEVAMDADSASRYAENSRKMGELEAEYGRLALNGGTGTRGAEIRKEHAELAAANETLLGDTKTLAETIHQEALTSNISFGALSKKYNETLSEEAAENGTFVYINGEDPRYVPAFTAAVAALGDGDISELLEIDGAFYIVRRVAAVEEGAVPYENVKAAAEMMTRLSKQDTAWNEASEAYITEALAAAVKYPANYANVGQAQ